MRLESLSQKITVSTAIITLAFSFTFGLASFWYIKSNLVEQASRKIHQETNSYQVSLESFLVTLNHDIESMSKNLLVVNALIDSVGRDFYIGPFLKGYKAPLETHAHLTLLDFEGKTIAFNQQSRTDYPSYKELISTTISKERSYAEIIKHDESTNLLLAYPVFYGATGMAEGILAMEISLSKIFSTVVSKDHAPPAHSFLSLHQGADPLIQVGVKSEHTFYSVHNQLNLPQALQGLQLNIEYGESLTLALAPLKKSL